jgi:chemotaxis protein MotB
MNYIFKFKLNVMLKRKLTPVLLIATVLFYSCGNSKKLETANADMANLKNANTELTNKNASLQKEVDDLTASNKSVNEEFGKYKADCEESKQQLAALQAIFMDIHHSMEEVEKKLETALADFNEKGVTVHEKDGLVYVNMEDNLLYKSGSSAMSEDGKKALGSVAAALNEYPKPKGVCSWKYRQCEI